MTGITAGMNALSADTNNSSTTKQRVAVVQDPVDTLTATFGVEGMTLENAEMAAMVSVDAMPAKSQARYHRVLAKTPVLKLLLGSCSSDSG